MASVLHYRYDFYLPSGFQPGDERGASFGPWQWFDKSASWTVEPFNLSTSTRTLEITRVQARTTPNQPVGNEYVYVFVRNLGPDPLYIWYLFLGLIIP